jgi:hypothetical protein
MDYLLSGVRKNSGAGLDPVRQEVWDGDSAV